MKTTILKKIGMIILFVGTISAAVNAQKKEDVLQPFYSNCEGAKDLKPTQIISKTDESGQYLVLHRKYDFAYDKQDRVTKKETYKWNSRKQEWTPNYMLSYTYNNDQVVIEYATWNKKTKAYSSAKEKAVYTITPEGITSYISYKRENAAKNWEITTNLTDLIPNRLIANK